jgi:hypothetical protein
LPGRGWPLGRGRGELRQGVGQHPLVLGRVAGMAKGSAGRKVDEHGARRGHLLQDVAHRADDERRDAARFDAVGEETNGLVAVRSVGDEQRQVGALAG